MQIGAGGEIGPDLPDGGVEAGRGNLAGVIGRGHMEGALVPADQVQQAGVGDLDSEGTARGPRRIADIRQVVWPGRGEWIHGLAEQERSLIQRDYFPTALGQAAGEAALGQDERRLHVAQHEFEAFGGIVRIERDVAGAGFQNRKCGQDAGRRALGKDSDGNVGARAQQLQPLGQARGALVELAVAQTEGTGGQRQGFTRLRSDHAGDRGILRVRGARFSQHIWSVAQDSSIAGIGQTRLSGSSGGTRGSKGPLASARWVRDTKVEIPATRLAPTDCSTLSLERAIRKLVLGCR